MTPPRFAAIQCSNRYNLYPLFRRLVRREVYQSSSRLDPQNRGFGVPEITLFLTIRLRFQRRQQSMAFKIRNRWSLDVEFLEPPRKLQMFDELLIRWSARIAVACYAARLVCDASHASQTSTQQIARGWSTLGCGWFLIHVITAFHFQHHWDHAAAFAYTARRTAELTGWNSGAGLYLNEAFLGLWLVDTGLWWWNLRWPQNRKAYWIVQGIFGFLMIQATVVFGPGFWRPVAVMFLAILVAVRLRSQRNHNPETLES